MSGRSAPALGADTPALNALLVLATSNQNNNFGALEICLSEKQSPVCVLGMNSDHTALKRCISHFPSAGSMLEMELIASSADVSACLNNQFFYASFFAPTPV
jgi:hypothetical protein